MTQDRLSRQDWIDEGVRALARSGFTALKAAPLAARLGVSRGSFYWHFADVEAYHEAVLRRWRQVAYDNIVGAVERGTGDRLRLLILRAFQADSRLERAVRAWATADPAAREMVAAVDRRRLDYLEGLLREAGLPPAVAARRAQVVNWAWLGHVLSAAGDGATSPPGTPEELHRLALQPAAPEE